MTAPYAIGSDHFPGLSKAVEELGELQQILGKILGCGSLDHWDGDLTDRLVNEIGDVDAALMFFVEQNLPDRRHDIARRTREKRAIFQEWHDAGDPPPEPRDATWDAPSWVVGQALIVVDDLAMLPYFPNGAVVHVGHVHGDGCGHAFCSDSGGIGLAEVGRPERLHHPVYRPGRFQAAR